MKLATIRAGACRDGRLVVVGPEERRAVTVTGFPTLLGSLDDWQAAAPRLRDVAARLARGEIAQRVRAVR